MTGAIGAVEGPPAELIFRRAVRPWAMVSELWRSRELVVVLTERELRARYKQTKVGFAWALITPFLMMVVFTVFFKRVAHVETQGIPYPLFSYVGLLPWTFFSGALSKGAVSIVQNLTLLNKVYCPREVFPLSSITVAGFDTSIALSILGVLFVVYWYAPQPESIWVIPLTLVLLAFTAGVTLACSALLVYLRDLRQVLPMILQFGLFATPVGYSLDVVPENWLPIYCFLNPLAPVIDGYRRSVLLGEPPRLGLLTLGAISSLIVLVGSYLMFKKMETGFADVA
jgi:ABC-2 type transport system permease protein/lipopolysaccharide transport system permease protein